MTPEQFRQLCAVYTPEVFDHVVAVAEAATGGPWWVGPTPGYLAMGQTHGGQPPLTIRSPEHTEEICTVWSCLLPAQANADHIAMMNPDVTRTIVGMLRFALEELARTRATPDHP